MRVDAVLDGRRIGILEMKPTGGFGFISTDWQTVRLKLGSVGSGEHELRFQTLEAHRPVNFDYFFVAEGDFNFISETPIALSSASSTDALLNLEVLGYQTRPDVRLQVYPHEVTAGRDTLLLRILNLDASAIDVHYTLNGRHMPIIHAWPLNQNHMISVFISDITPKGRYVYEAIRDSGNRSPFGWIRVDVPIVVK